jgi:hypothetical protein
MKRKFDESSSVDEDNVECEEEEVDRDEEKEERVGVITEKSQELEYKRVQQLEEDDSVKMKLFCLAFIDINDSNDTYNIYYDARNIETVQRHFARLWLNKVNYPRYDDDESELVDLLENSRKIDHSGRPMLGKDMIDKILAAYSELQPEQVSEIRKLSNNLSDDSCDQDMLNAKLYEFLCGQHWQKIPYWLVKVIFELSNQEDEDGDLDTIHYISEIQTRSINRLLVERRKLARNTLLSQKILGRDIIEIIICFS